MTEQILKCCNNHSKFLVSYIIGSKFYVCKNCINLEHWARGIQSKEEIDLKTRKKNPGYGHTYVNLKGIETS